MATDERDIVVYTAPFCAPCEQLKRFLTSHGVAFRVRDLMMDEDAQFYLCKTCQPQEGGPSVAPSWSMGLFLLGESQT